MYMVHDILYFIFEIKEGIFCWGIDVATEAHGEILKIIAKLESDVNESINPVID